MAVSDADGTATLEVAKVNMGDHRVRVGEGRAAGRMAEGERETIEVPMRSLDSLVGDGTVSLDDVALAWVDTQGHEAHVLAGATCLAEARVPAYVEYWPYALERAGGLERLNDIIQGEWGEVADIGFGNADAKRRPAGEIGAIAASYDPRTPTQHEPAPAAALTATSMLLLMQPSSVESPSADSPLCAVSRPRCLERLGQIGRQRALEPQRLPAPRDA